jgi:hypothetical protein
MNMSERVSAEKRTKLAAAGITLLLGGLVAIVVNVLHPRPPERTDELLTLAATVPHWTLIHYLAAFATPLIVSGLSLLVATFADPVARATGETGKYVTALGAGTFMIAIVIDGWGYPHLERVWMAAAGAEEKSTILSAASAVHTIDAALFPVWAGLFLGLGLVLVAIALWRNGDWPRWFAAAGILGGSMCFVFAASVVFGVRVPLPLWPLGPAINGVWLTALGAMLLRRVTVTLDTRFQQ